MQFLTRETRRNENFVGTEQKTEVCGDVLRVMCINSR